MTTINLAVIAGDGIGPEVVNEGLKVLDVVSKKYGVEFKKTSYDLGAAFWHRTGEVLPDATLVELAKADVILLGADFYSSFALPLITTSICDLLV
jgi:3-isopropylmalate dehydrogenase